MGLLSKTSLEILFSRVRQFHILPVEPTVQAPSRQFINLFYEFTLRSSSAGTGMCRSGAAVSEKGMHRERFTTAFRCSSKQERLSDHARGIRLLVWKPCIATLLDISAVIIIGRHNQHQVQLIMTSIIIIIIIISSSSNSNIFIVTMVAIVITASSSATTSATATSTISHHHHHHHHHQRRRRRRRRPPAAPPPGRQP